MDRDESLRQHLCDLLTSGNAHVEFDRAIADLPTAARGQAHPNFPHTPWQLLEHMRIAQWDILRFSVDPEHQSPEFPAGYWPVDDAPPDAEAWDRTIEAFRADRQGMIDLVLDPATDLFAKLPHGDGQTVLREALLVADHNAYHLGQLIAVRRFLGVWED